VQQIACADELFGIDDHDAALDRDAGQPLRSGYRFEPDGEADRAQELDDDLERIASVSSSRFARQTVAIGVTGEPT